MIASRNESTRPLIAYARVAQVGRCREGRIPDREWRERVRLGPQSADKDTHFSTPEKVSLFDNPFRC
jgi:hypothetical protein